VHVNYFNVSFDLEVQVAGLKLMRKILKTPPLRCVYINPFRNGHVDDSFSDLSTGEVLPGLAVPDDANGGSEANWEAYVLQNFGSVAHPIGAAAMMRRELGGQFGC
jgi:choline dehydrogenase